MTIVNATDLHAHEVGSGMAAPREPHGQSVPPADGVSVGSSENRLVLPSLRIRGFRGFEDLTIPRLGRITLITGANGVGKSTVLEAAEIFESRGRIGVLDRLLSSRSELATMSDDDGNQSQAVAYETLFHNSGKSVASSIMIGPNCGTDDLRISLNSTPDWPMHQQRLFGDIHMGLFAFEGGVRAAAIRA